MLSFFGMVFRSNQYAMNLISHNNENVTAADDAKTAADDAKTAAAICLYGNIDPEYNTTLLYRTNAFCKKEQSFIEDVMLKLSNDVLGARNGVIYRIMYGFLNNFFAFFFPNSADEIIISSPSLLYQGLLVQKKLIEKKINFNQNNELTEEEKNDIVMLGVHKTGDKPLHTMNPNINDSDRGEGGAIASNMRREFAVNQRAEFMEAWDLKQEDISGEVRKKALNRLPFLMAAHVSAAETNFWEEQKGFEALAKSVFQKMRKPGEGELSTQSIVPLWVTNHEMGGIIEKDSVGSMSAYFHDTSGSEFTEGKLFKVNGETNEKIFQNLKLLQDELEIIFVTSKNKKDKAALVEKSWVKIGGLLGKGIELPIDGETIQMTGTCSYTIYKALGRIIGAMKIIADDKRLTSEDAYNKLPEEFTMPGKKTSEALAKKVNKQLYEILTSLNINPGSELGKCGSLTWK